MATRKTRRNRGFTLTELLVVITIIGLLLTFILVASRDAVRTANEKATLSLIVKLETGLNERIEAIMAQRGKITNVHRLLATTFLNSGQTLPLNPGTDPNPRAQVIAQFDQVKAELPDFFVINPPPAGRASTYYPLNFGGIPYPPSGTAPENYMLPLGQGLPAVAPLFGENSPTESTGIYGASYSAAAGIYKNLGYLPQGYDGVDNNGDGYIDDLKEGTGGDPTRQAQIASQLANHTHNTARSEMLYALLVEGQGPLGSVFNPDDFTKSEVRDTDGDGLPEFVDTWGNPLQFFRWPIYYNPVATGGIGAYIQKGIGAYAPTEQRQLDPLDPAQSLLTPVWWWSTVNAGSPHPEFSAKGQASAGAVAFMTYFHSLMDPIPDSDKFFRWDRSGFFQRRAFYSRPLIISAGPDGYFGVTQLSHNYQDEAAASLSLGATSDGTGAPWPNGSPSAFQCLQYENLAYQINPLHFSQAPTGTLGGFIPVPPAADTQTDLHLRNSAGLDDISNQSLSSPGGGVR